MVQDTFQPYAEQDTRAATDKTDTIQEGQMTEEDKIADLQADPPADHPQDTHLATDAQERTEAQHHTK